MSSGVAFIVHGLKLRPAASSPPRTLTGIHRRQQNRYLPLITAAEMLAPWRDAHLGALLAFLLALNPVFAAYDLDPNSTGTQSSRCATRTIRKRCPLTEQNPESIISISKDIVEDMLSFYHGDEEGHIVGLLPEPYYCTSAPSGSW